MEYRTALRCGKCGDAFEQSVRVPEGFSEQEWNILKGKLLLQKHYLRGANETTKR